MLEDHADDAAYGVDVAVAIGHALAAGLAVAEQAAFDEHPALVVAVEERHAAQQGALAGTGRADHAHHPRVVHREVDAAQDVRRAEPLVQALDQDHGAALGSAACRFAAHDARPNRRSAALPASAMPSMSSQ